MLKAFTRGSHEGDCYVCLIYIIDQQTYHLKILGKVCYMTKLMQ